MESKNVNIPLTISANGNLEFPQHLRGCYIDPRQTTTLNYRVTTSSSGNTQEELKEIMKSMPRPRMFRSMLNTPAPEPPTQSPPIKQPKYKNYLKNKGKHKRKN